MVRRIRHALPAIWALAWPKIARSVHEQAPCASTTLSKETIQSRVTWARIDRSTSKTVPPLRIATNYKTEVRPKRRYHSSICKLLTSLSLLYRLISPRIAVKARSYRLTMLNSSHNQVANSGTKFQVCVRTRFPSTDFSRLKELWMNCPLWSA